MFLSRISLRIKTDSLLNFFTELSYNCFLYFSIYDTESTYNT